MSPKRSRRCGVRASRATKVLYRSPESNLSPRMTQSAGRGKSGGQPKLEWRCGTITLSLISSSSKNLR